RRSGEAPRLLVGGLIGVGMLVALGFWWRDRPRVGTGAARRPPRFYTRALRSAARRDLRPGPGETAREFAHRVAAREPTWAAEFHHLTLRYEDARFGPRPLGPEESAALEVRAATLGKLIRYTDAAR
ncbi:MAG TPA: DUF4129 domain-containing protein, partial [Methylomirabilota bacterium]|nr:DUF4129 domain-containing protein [Methylomirabilota bacterium]